MSHPTLILGATSGIARAIAQRLAQDGHDLVLAGRSRDELERCAADIGLRFDVRTAVVAYDALDFAAHPACFDACTRALPDGLEGVVLCHGVLPEQDETELDFEVAQRAIGINYSSAVSLLNLAARYFEQRGQGWICGLSSVAGDRGRRSNHLYGSTKAGLDVFLQGLEARLAAAGVSVLRVKPGFVDTGMTYARPGMFLVASPERVARDVVRALRRGRSVVYTPRFWWAIMAVIRLIPTPIFRRLPL